MYKEKNVRYDTYTKRNSRTDCYFINCKWYYIFLFLRCVHILKNTHLYNNRFSINVLK